MVMNPIALKAHEDYTKQIKEKTYNTIFPTGANNMSSAYKKSGEGFYVAGSQCQQDDDIKGGSGGDIWAGDGEGVTCVKQD
jgi:hypothetical protein